MRSILAVLPQTPGSRLPFPTLAWVALLALGCGPRVTSPSDTGTSIDAGGDADTDADSDADADADTDADTDLGGCGSGPDSTAVWDSHPIAVAGATTQSTPYSFDAGVQAVVDAAMAATTASTETLAVTGAIVTARGYVPAVNDGTASFWFEDANAAMYAYRVNLGGYDPATLAPGDEVSFTVTRVLNFSGTPEVAGDPTNSEPGITGFTVTSHANPVHVVDHTDGSEVTWEADGLHLVNLWGQFVTDPSTCGGSSVCFDLQYGSHTIAFRTASAYDQKGDCVQWIGPVTQFGSAPQLNADDFDWYQWF